VFVVDNAGHGIKMVYTRDTDYHRFPFLQVVDPIA
jgi:predicted nucleic acid-binding protein